MTDEASQAPNVELTDTLEAVFKAVSPSGNNTRLHLFAFAPEHGREKVVLVAHGSEAALLMQLILRNAEPIFENTEVL